MKNFLALLMCGLAVAGCNQKPTLQKYFVEHTENKDFVAVDVSPGILNLDPKKLSPEQRQALKSFDKMNILAFKADTKNQAMYETECNKVKTILKDQKYQQLMHFGSGKEGASVSFVGDDEHIDEFVLFANKKENGFAVVRILGDDMSPSGIVSMLSALKASDINLEQLKPLQQLLQQQQ